MLARTLIYFCVLIGLLLRDFMYAAEAPTAPGQLRAGTALVDITPTKFPVIVNGGFLEGSAKAVIDPLHARALVLANDQTKLAIVVVDSCMLPRELLDRAKELASKATGIPTDKMLISATHTHTAPSAMGALGSRPDPDYPEFLIPLLARAIETAHQKLQPAQLGWGVIDDHEHTFHRRWIYRSDKMLVDPFGEKSVRAMMNPGHMNPDVVGPSGPVDPGLTVVGIKTRAGKPLAVLANYSMHYYGSPALSADYYGRFCAKMRQAIVGDDKNDDFLAIMSQGTSGDLNAIDTTKPAKPRDIDAFAQGIADNALKVYRKLEYKSDVPLAMSESLLKLKRRVPDEKRLAWAKEKIAAMGDRRPKDRSEVYALEAVFLHEEPERELKLQALRLGDLAVTAMPNEVFAITGLKLKQGSRFAGTMNISLANGSEGYIPPAEQHALGGYTTWAARTAALVPEAEQKIVINLSTQLGNLHSNNPYCPGPPIRSEYAKIVLDSKPDAFWELEEMHGDHLNVGEKQKAFLEPGYALYLDGPSHPALSKENKTNHAIHFAGGRIHIGRDLGKNYTAEFWFWNGLPHDARPVTAYLFSRGDPSDMDANGDHLGIGGTHRGAGRLIFFNGNTQQELLVGQTELKLKHWHHVVLVREGTRVTVYLDGNPEPDISGSAKVTSESGHVFFAGRSDKFALLEGKLDEISLYNRALPTEEVMKHAKAAGLEPPPAKQSRALSPVESQKTLHLAPGLRAELVAAEPEVQSPVAMAFDERGRLWVVEMIDYPNGPKPGEPGQSRIKLLTDNDGNGRFENARVFADKLLFANGLIPYRDGVIVTAAPEILWLRDTDDDGVCDKREVLYKGFATGNPQLRVSHPILLPDGRICVVNGLRGGKIVRGGDTPGEPIDISGRDFAFDPRTGKAEAITGMGQYGNTLDDAGNRFVCTNRNHWIHIGLDEKYLRRNPWMAVPPRAGDNQGAGGAARIFPLTHQVTTANEHQGTFTAACGVHVYRGIGLPQEYRGAIFTCDPTANLIHHEILVPHGSTFVGKPGLAGQEFLASTDPWFRPVFLCGGPDGALYVTDMYRKVIEHPEWLPPSLRGSPDFDEGKERGRIWRIVAEEKPKVELGGFAEMAKLPLKDPTPATLVHLLYHPDAWWQTTAQRLLLDVKLEDHGLSANWLKTPGVKKEHLSAYVLGATLYQQQGLLDNSDLINVANQTHHQAIKLLVLRLSETNFQDFLNKCHTRYVSDAMIACQFAASAGCFDDDRILPPLAAILEHYHDDAQVRLAVLSSVATRSDQLVALLLGDKSTFRVALTSVKLQALSDLASIVAARRDPDELELLLDAAFAVQGNSARRIQLAVRKGLIDGATRRGEQLPAVLARLPVTNKSLADKVTKLADESLAIACDAAKSAPERSAAIAECAQLDWAKVRPVLTDLLQAEHDARVRVAAVRALGTFTKPEVAPALVAALSEAPQDQTQSLEFQAAAREFHVAALDALLSQPDRTIALLAAIESGTIDPRGVDAARQTLLTHRRRDIRERAAAIFAGMPTLERQAIVKEYLAALKLTGDPKRGEELFRGKATCAQCHRVGDVGHAVGPNLSELRTKTPAMLLNDILDPNGAIDANFVNYSITLTSGKTVTGIIAAESSNSLTLRRAENQTDTISRTDIEPDGLVNTRRSLMPEGIEKTLSVQEIADVIAYLQRWRELP